MGEGENSLHAKIKRENIVSGYVISTHRHASYIPITGNTRIQQQDPTSSVGTATMTRIVSTNGIAQFCDCKCTVKTWNTGYR